MEKRAKRNQGSEGQENQEVAMTNGKSDDHEGKGGCVTLETTACMMQMTPATHATAMPRTIVIMVSASAATMMTVSLA